GSLPAEAWNWSWLTDSFWRSAKLSVQGHVERQHVHPRLAPNSPGAPFQLVLHYRANAPFLHLASLSHPGDLPEGRFAREVGIQSAPRGGDQLRGNRAAGVRILLFQPGHVLGYPGPKLFRGGAQVGAGGGRPIVTLPRGGGPRLKVTRLGE